MASAVSKPVPITTGTSVRNKKTNYYVSEVTSLGDGSLKRETFRSDAQGNNRVLVQTTISDKTGKVTNTTTGTGATTEEKRALKNPNSQLRNGIRTTTKDAGDVVQKNEADAAAGGLTDAGKRNQEIIAGGSGNSASGADDGTSQPAFGLGSENANQNIPGQSAPLRYPTDIAQTTQDVVKFDMLEFSPKPLTQSGGFGQGERSDASTRTLGSTILAIPGGIKDSNATGWGDGSMNALEAALAGIALGGIQDGGEGLTNSITQTIGNVVGGSDDVKNAIAASFAGSAAGVGQQLLTRTTGAILNPNMELLFKGPSLRPFDFSFLLAPRDPGEAEEVINIIRFFKQGMAPIRSKSNLFLRSPNTFKVTYLHRGESGKEHFGLNKFKECALLGLNVDYTPNANYATFTDGTMVAYRLTMRFQELEPVFNDDYQNEQNSIGF
jgi:hypothetical protein